MKKQKKESVVQDWISYLPFTQQAVLLVALRGPDGMTKWNGCKKMTFFIRGVILHAAYPNYDDSYPESFCFMRCDYNNFNTDLQQFFREVDEMPHHYLMHTLHAAQIIGYKHPDPYIASLFGEMYLKGCKDFHMNAESVEDMDKRLKM